MLNVVSKCANAVGKNGDEGTFVATVATARFDFFGRVVYVTVSVVDGPECAGSISKVGVFGDVKFCTAEGDAFAYNAIVIGKTCERFFQERKVGANALRQVTLNDVGGVVAGIACRRFVGQVTFLLVVGVRGVACNIIRVLACAQETHDSSSERASFGRKS